MRILFVYQFCTLGGVEAVLRNRLPAFSQRGISSEVIFLKDDGGSKSFQGFDNVYIESKEHKLLRMIDEGEFDFIIPIDTPQIYPILNRSRFRGTLVTEAHTSNLDILQYLSFIGDTKTKAIITPSRFEAELILRQVHDFRKTGIPIYVVPNPIDLEFFQFKAPRTASCKKIIGWVGRLEEGKNWKHFLEIAAALCEKRDDLSLLVIGGNYAEPSVKKDFLAAVKRLNLIDLLRWIPYLHYDRMPGAYSLIAASGGCLVTTSLTESFGITAIEAMACQCPVVASRAGGFEEIIEEGKNGFLFGVNNTREAVEKIEIILQGVSQRNELIGNGYSTVRERYAPDKVTDAYAGILDKLMKKPA